MGARSAALHSCVGVRQWPEQQAALVAVVLSCTGWSPAGCPAAGGPATGLPATGCTSRLHQHTVAISLHAARHTAVVNRQTKKYALTCCFLCFSQACSAVGFQTQSTTLTVWRTLACLL
jgi:hypothetical protein